MKKQTIKGLAFIVAAGTMATSCDLIKDLSYEVTPKVLEMHGDSVRVSVDVQFPAKGIRKKVSAEITALMNIDNIDKFLRWKQNVSNSIKSKRIQNVKPQTLNIETNEPIVDKVKSKLNTSKNDKIQTLENFI
jgi:hypothetical protein